MPQKCIEKLCQQIKKVEVLHKKDKEKGYDKTLLPNSLAKKYPGEADELRC